METRTVYLEPGKIEVRTETLPELQPNQLLVKTHQASVCGSERYFYRGITVRPEDDARGEPDASLKEAYAYPMGPLGHEGGGIVEEIGSAVNLYLGGGKVSVGDRVAAGKTSAAYKDGVLTVTLPKAEEAKRKVIDIEVS